MKGQASFEVRQAADARYVFSLRVNSNELLIGTPQPSARQCLKCIDMLRFCLRHQEGISYSQNALGRWVATVQNIKMELAHSPGCKSHYACEQLVKLAAEHGPTAVVC